MTHVRTFTMSNISVIIALVAALSLTVADDRCEPGAVRFEDNCYTFVVTLLPFNRANASCSGRGGQLAIIKDHSTARFIRAFFKKMTLYYWIGISDQHSEGTWRYISDNTSLGYQNWHIGEPNDGNKDEDCAVMRPDLNMEWDDRSCKKEFLYICQYEGSSIHCLNETKFQGNCLEFSRQRLNFTQAEQTCINRGGKLAEFKTMEEQLFVEDRINQETWWKSLTDLQMDQYYDWNYGAWIGVHKADGKWLYVDGTEILLPFWGSGQPSSSENTNCGLLSDEWMSYTCDIAFFSFCQFKLNTSPTKVSTEIHTTPMSNKNADDRCQPGAFRFNENCYTYVARPQPFNRAKELCSGRGGQLAIIKDRSTARFIRALHKKMTALGYWIGISDRHSEGIWSYISDNTSLTYQNWNVGEPNDAGKDQDCAVMTPTRGLAWDDSSCNKKFLYICQYKGSSIHCKNENRFREDCFEFSRQRLTFIEAEQTCINSGGKLAELKTMKEQLFLEDRINQETWWKSLSDQQMDQIDDWNYGAWIGVHKVDGKWIYLDGTKVLLPFWGFGQPSSSENTNCGLVSDEWKSNTCDKYYSSFCQFKAFIPTDPPVLEKPVPTCSEPGTISNGIRIPDISTEKDYKYLVDAQINFVCKDNFQLDGAAKITCTASGTWDQTLPKCKRSSPVLSGFCKKPTRPENGDFRAILPGSEKNPPDDSYYPGTVIVYECNDMYNLRGSSQRTCLTTGNWGGSEATCEIKCGRITYTPDQTSFIINGETSKQGAWPWQIALALNFDTLKKPTQVKQPGGTFAAIPTSDGWGIACGAALINSQWVLTAAHCLINRDNGDEYPANAVMVYAGKHFRENSQDDLNIVQPRKALEIYIHENFRYTTLEADIALILLEQPIVFTKWVLPVCLPTSDWELQENEVVGVIAGWGFTEANEPSNELRQATMKWAANAECEKNFTEPVAPAIRSEIKDGMFCGVPPVRAADSSQSCSGDSGGPLVFPVDSGDTRRWVVEGLVSWGNSYCVGLLTIFTQVRNYMEFISSYVPVLS